MKKILSVDFDYFIDVKAEERDTLFPIGADEMLKEELSEKWVAKIKEFPEILDIGVIGDFELVETYFKKKSKGSKIVIADSHKEIQRVIRDVPKRENLDIVNIDFHHDYYHYFTAGEEYNCGNWLRRVKEDRPNTKIRWVRRDDSQLVSLEGEFPYASTTNIKEILNVKYDYIFLCFSPEWTPPHLVSYYRRLIKNLKGEIL